MSQQESQLVSTMSQDEGNTKTSSLRARHWCFTINNYTDDELSQCLTTFDNKKWKYIIGLEVGEEKETPHMQGFISHKNQLRLDTLKKIMPRAHLEIARGNLQQNYAYCSKGGNFITNIKIETPQHLYNEQMKQDYDNVVWHPWQQHIIDLVNTPPSNRKVHWFWETEGNVGKSFLVTYLDWKLDAIIANGKQNDVFNQYRDYLENKQKQPTLAIIDIPRSHKEYICYSTFEKIKDGLFYSGKYEGGKLNICRHHLIVFANFEPQWDKLSADRWDVKYIWDNQLKPTLPPPRVELQYGS